LIEFLKTIFALPSSTLISGRVSSEDLNGQKTLRVDTLAATSVQLSGTYQKLEVNNAGYVDADSSTVYDHFDTEV
jgi:hypothetical protein